MVEYLNELTLGSLQYALTGRQTDGNKITLMNLVPEMKSREDLIKMSAAERIEHQLRQNRCEAAWRGLWPVALWLAAILSTAYWVSDSIPTPGVNAGARALLVGSDGTSGDDNLSNSWYSVLGFNVIQLILLVSGGVLIPLKKYADIFYQWQRQWKWAEKLPWPFKQLKNLGASIISSNLFQIARLGVDIGFFFVSAAAVWYSLEAFSRLSNLQPDDSSASNDARDALIKLFALVALQLLVLLQFRERDAGKSQKSPGLLLVEINQEDQKGLDEDGEKKPQVAGIDYNFNARKDLKIHNFY